MIAIHEIQGRGHLSPFAGQEVETHGIVTVVDSNGFYIQDPVGDGDDATSEGLFLFTGGPPDLDVGDEVDIVGTVSEFVPGGPGTANLSITQIAFPDISVVSSGNQLPDPVVIGSDGREVPTGSIDSDNLTNFNPETDAIDFFESLEGMKVQINDAFAIGPTSRFGETPVVPDGGENVEDRTDTGGVFISPDDFNPERLLLDDAISDEVPSATTGDQFDGSIHAVVSYSFGNFKFLYTEDLPNLIEGGTSRETTNLVGTDDQLTIASYNVLNLDPSDGSVQPSEDQLTQLSFDIVDNLQSPDIIALQEIQDNNGTDDDGETDASETLEKLVEAIEIVGGPEYEFIEIDPVNNADGGQPGSNIRVAYLYNPERVGFNEAGDGGPSNPTAILPGGDLSLNPGRVDPNNIAFAEVEEIGFDGTRKSLATQFEFNGETVFVINNHFKSKGGDTPLFGATQQPNPETEIQRTAQAQVVNDFVSDILSEDPNANVVVLGDFNDFEFSPTLFNLAGQVLTNLEDTLLADSDNYSFIFDGNSQALDHVLVSSNLLPLSEVDRVHINADFPTDQRGSDHDPVVARFSFSPFSFDVASTFPAEGEAPFDESAAEIVSYDPLSQRLFVTNGDTDAIDIIDASDPQNPTLASSIDITSIGGGVNSVDVKNGYVAAAIEAETSTDPGSIAIFDTDGNLIDSAEAGALPDMVTFTPDGGYALTANEGEPDDGVDPLGTISIFKINADGTIASSTLLDFSDFNDQREALQAEGARFFPDIPVDQDVEPEYIAVSPDGTQAFVTLQENNAVAILDLENKQIVDLQGLGFKDHSLAGNELDASDRDGIINIQNWPVHGMYMPDAIASFEVNGETFYATANEGDARDEDERVDDLTLDPTAFPDADELQQEQNLGRLEVSTIDGDTDGDGDFDELFAYGARSVSIWNDQGQLVWDSGALFEEVTAATFPNFFNSDNDENTFDTRSDAKGPEPEAVISFDFDSSSFLAVGLERIGGIVVINVDDPANPKFVTYFNNRDFNGDPENGTAGDLGPEGLEFISEADSADGNAYLVVANEVSGTTSLYQFDPFGDNGASSSSEVEAF